MKRVVVTPAGRKRYLEVLYEYMKKEKSKESFIDWHLWINTNIVEDIEYCKYLAQTNPWIKTIELPDIDCVSSFNIYKFFKYACEEDSVYVRLDDDVVFVENGFFDKIFKYREENPEPFLVYGNIINNAVLSHIHQRNCLFNYRVLSGYSCMDEIGWKDPLFAELVHRTFINDVKSGNIDKWHRSFRLWKLDYFERVSINCISWLGSTFKEFNGEVGQDEEKWLSVDKPTMLNKPNVIFGDAIVAHFGFYVQREYLDKTDILNTYKELANSM